MATDTVTDKATMIWCAATRGNPGCGHVAGVTFCCCDDMCWSLANGDDAIMTTGTKTDDFIMING
jgi:hypothetical protein